LDQIVRACFKNRDGSPAVSWVFEPDRKQISSRNTDAWAGKTVVLNDIFTPQFSDEQLDLFFKKVILLEDAKIVILTAHPSRMNEYMRRIHDLSESGYWERPKWLKLFAWEHQWKNVWYGVTIKTEEDADTMTQLVRMPSSHRFIVLRGDVHMDVQWTIPKCKRCNGRGWYLERFADNHGTACTECPVWELSEPGFHKGQHFIRDHRELGGEINWIIVPEPSEVSREVLESALAAQRQYSTAVYVQGGPKRLRQSPL
jgi:hypothetical protein